MEDLHFEFAAVLKELVVLVLDSVVKEEQDSVFLSFASFHFHFPH